MSMSNFPELFKDASQKYQKGELAGKDEDLFDLSSRPQMTL